MLHISTPSVRASLRQKTYLAGALIGACLAFAASEAPLFERPAHFPAPVYDFAAHPLDSATVALGRRLFYDELLSADTTVACASCHSPYNAFAHTDHELSHGIHDRIGLRNAPALFNLAWATSFHRDGAHHSIELQALAPIHHADEMGSDIATVVGRLRENPHYASGFAKAYKDTAITGERVLRALAQFQLTLVSAGAKYDRVALGQDSFSSQERKGLALFETHCNGCHTAPLFTNQDFASNGLPVDPTLNDFGRVGITARPADSLHFKVPPLRNLTFTRPYMHDGRFRTLRAVLEHYATRDPDPIPLSADDRADLTAFLLTLDDRDFVFDERHGFPRPNTDL